MIEATETQVQGDIFDFLRIIDDDVPGLMGPDEIGYSSADFSLHAGHQIGSVMRSETKVTEQA